MRFNTHAFLAFFALMLVLHYAPFSWRARKRNLLLV